MASIHNWHIFNDQGEHVATCKYAEDAAAFVSITGNGATVKSVYDEVLWTEGKENHSAGESYDGTASILHARLSACASRRSLRRY